MLLNLSPKTTCLDRRHFYGHWGDLAKQVLLYVVLQGRRPSTAGLSRQVSLHGAIPPVSDVPTQCYLFEV